MGKNLKIESTDSKADRDIAALQPYKTVQLTIVTAAPSVQREDGSTEHGEDDIQNLSTIVPGRELKTNMALYAERVAEFKKQYPEFDRYVGQDIEIPLSVRDEILRQPNGPEIALFLGFAPDVIEQLNKMNPLTRRSALNRLARISRMPRFQAAIRIKRATKQQGTQRKPHASGNRQDQP
jgi:hypothetical protein